MKVNAVAEKPKTKVILLVGESGCGKTTLQKELIKRGCKCIESFTTRKPRFKGEEGHAFSNESHYDLCRVSNSMVAETVFNGNKYWTTEYQFKETGTLIYIVDIKGVVDCINNLPRDIDIYSIFLRSSAITRLNRMIEDNRPYEEIISRLKHDEIAFKDKDKFDFDLIIDANRELDFVLADAMKFIRKIGV